MDRYDEAVAYLTQNPDKIRGAWVAPSRHVHTGGALFQTAVDEKIGSVVHGCLTQIRKFPQRYRAQTPSLTKAILDDDRLPTDEKEITVDHLPIFAEWQRRIDEETGRDREIIHYVS